VVVTAAATVVAAVEVAADTTNDAPEYWLTFP
jgi:hypothetical protein